ncbi:E3 ubiquitin-protein ligase TRIM39 isoform X2 [Rhea pennata]|uniref:E3 ubiquitin-protein ligase TRIM39 isoform X2 n=1 Tax=Rhea pennata TaxID=8795 RepID=UPI002E25A2B5
MAAAADPLETLRAEASCAVCLEYLRDPVLIECGHNFCRVCITRWWAGPGPGPDRRRRCPVCRRRCRRRSLRPNRQLGSVAEAARRLRPPERLGPAGGLCKQHGQALARFCRHELAALCAACESSPAHRAHAVVPLEAATREYKRKVARRRESIARDFEELHRLLEEEERLLRRRLEEEEREILQRLRANLARLGERRRGLAALAAELHDKCRQPGPDLLRDIQDTLARCEEAAEPAEPAPVPIELEKTFGSFPRQYFTLRKLARRLIGDVTLDPDTAHPNLVLSADRKSVRFVAARPRELPDTPRRFTLYPCVLAAQGFTSGRHYWEVEVGDKTHWALGVCKDSVSRKGEATPLPETGYWRVRLWNGDKYAATTSPFTPLTLRVKPRRVGVFVDYEAGKVAFYNVTDRSHIYTFSVTFTEKIWPLFYPGIRAGRKNAAPLVIRSPTDWE